MKRTITVIDKNVSRIFFKYYVDFFIKNSSYLILVTRIEFIYLLI